MQVHVHADARRTIARQTKNLSLRGGIKRIKASAHQHLFAVKRPAFDEDAVRVLPADLVFQMIRDRKLQEVSGDSFVAEHRARIFDRRANVEVLTFGIVSRNEIETRRVLVVNARSIHEAAGTCRLEGFG